MDSKRCKVFLLFTFALTWLSWWMLAYLTQSGLLQFQSVPGQVIFILGGSAPTIGAYIAVLLTVNEGSLKEFHTRVLKVKVGFKYYLYAILVPVVLGLFGLALAYFTGDRYFAAHPIQPLFFFIPLFFTSIFMGGLEEFGWRGVLQPALTNKLSLFTANLFIGITWAFWHLPLFYVAGAHHEGKPFLFFTLGAIGYSSFITWLYAKTNSIILCVLFHASINAAAATGLSVSMGAAAVYPYYAVFVMLSGLIFLTLMGSGSSVSAVRDIEN